MSKMKKIIAILLVIFMLLPLCLTACNDEGDATTGTKGTSATSGTTKPTDTNNQNGGNTENNGGNTENNGGNTENNGGNTDNNGGNTDNNGGNTEDNGGNGGAQNPSDPVELERVTSYVPEATFNKIVALFEETGNGGTAYWMEGAPYAYGDKQAFKGKTLDTISIPVYGTKSASNGNFIFTLSIFKDTPEAIANSAPLRTYQIKISAEKYGLAENASNVFKVITVDLTEYDITVADDELLAVANASDTLIVAYAAGGNPIITVMKREFPQMCGFSLKIGRSAWNPEMGNSLIYNFTFKEEYDTAEEYYDNATLEEMLKVVEGVYGDKNLSVFGDSISTLNGVSNGAKYNSTIGNNVAYYANGQYTPTTRDSKNSPISIDETYWGRFVSLAGMSLCVNNSWGGDALFSDRYINRVQQLHNTAGDTPDLILTYFGINDAHSSPATPVGDLTALLANRGSKTEAEVIKTWLEGVIANKANYNSFDFDEMYAYMLYLMTEKYPNAKVVCVSLVSNKLGERNGADVEKYNVIIKALAEYFDALYVDQGNVITVDNRALYMMDGDLIHPNYAGHGLIFEEIIRTLYADIISDPDFDASDYPVEDEDESDGYTVESHYVPEATMDKLVGLYETLKKDGTAYAFGVAPFAFNDLETFKGKKITSITMPIISTGALDANGCFTFTLSIYKSDFGSIQSSQAVRVIKVKISAAEHGLLANASNVYDFITVDLRDDNVVVGQDEMICFGLSGDTIFPAYISDGDCTKPIGKVMKKEFPQMCGFTLEVGRTAWNPHAYAANSLIFDFTFETVYDTKSDYEALLKEDEDFGMMLEAVKDAYGDKNLSVFGDSISTFVGISKDTSYNTTIGDNAVWYGSRGTGGLYDYTYTYWGSFVRLADMNLCVNNAWSGDSLGSGRFRTRAVNLHNDNTGETPDLILVYFGINDTWGSGRSATEWKALYDELLGLITNKYPNAKIVCVGLTTNYGKKDYPNADTLVPQYNAALKELCTKYGTLYVDQASVINSTNYQSYMHDDRVLHPNAAGHEIIFKEIIKALYKDLQK